MIKNFSLIPDVKYRRSKFHMPHGVKTSFNVGQLIPIHCQEVLAGDSWKSKVSVVARVTSSFIKPVMDNVFLDVMHFFVPLRMVYDNYERVFGNPNPSAYEDNDLAEFPRYSQIKDNNDDPIKSITISEKTVLDYLGLPTGKITSDVTSLQARAFALIYDKWFRNENTTNEMFIYTGDTDEDELPNNNAWSNTNYTGKLPYVCKYKDYFTSCLPKPQKGASVRLPLMGFAPVITGSTSVDTNKDGEALAFRIYDPTEGSVVNNTKLEYSEALYNDNSGRLRGDYVQGASAGSYMLRPSNLMADLKQVTNADINDVRFAFQLQRLLENDALYGSRINEIYMSLYGVSPRDLLVNTPEFLGGGKIPISVQQVEQTSEATTGNPLGAVAGFSLTNGYSKFSKSFTEHGYIITVACVRYPHTYQQGIPKQFLRRDRNDIYNPFFAHLGNQPVYTSEIFATYGAGDTPADPRSSAFGYNEAWSDYRFIPNRLSGEMRSNATNSQDVWHFADYYANAPTLSDTFVKETPLFFNRTVSVPSETSEPGVTPMDNFIADFYFDTSAIRVMPTYSVPGLIDHK